MTLCTCEVWVELVAEFEFECEGTYKIKNQLL